MTRPFFTRDRISHFETFDSYAEEAIVLLTRRFDEGFSVDIQDVFARFTLDVASESLFGACVHSLRDALPYPLTSKLSRFDSSNDGYSRATMFSRAFAESQSVAAKRVHMGFLWPLFEVFRDKAKDPMAVCNAYLEPFVADALRKKELDVAKPCLKLDEINDNDTLLDHLVRLTDGKLPPVVSKNDAYDHLIPDRKIIKDEIFNIMIAGRDTVRYFSK